MKIIDLPLDLMGLALKNMEMQGLIPNADLYLISAFDFDHSYEGRDYWVMVAEGKTLDPPEVTKTRLNHNFGRSIKGFLKDFNSIKSRAKTQEELTFWQSAIDLFEKESESLWK
jgi:hypothetical protein